MTERDIQNALYRCLAGMALIPNTTAFGWEADMIGVTRDLRVREYEIKVTFSDFRADAKKQLKHMQLASGRGPHLFYYVIPEALLERVRPEMPAKYGLIVCQADGTIRYERRPKGLHLQELSSRRLFNLLSALSWKHGNSRLGATRAEVPADIERFQAGLFDSTTYYGPFMDGLTNSRQ
jgi:hypothetical protein